MHIIYVCTKMACYNIFCVNWYNFSKITLSEKNNYSCPLRNMRAYKLYAEILNYKAIKKEYTNASIKYS